MEYIILSAGEKHNGDVPFMHGEMPRGKQKVSLVLRELMLYGAQKVHSRDIWRCQIMFFVGSVDELRVE